MPEPGDQHKCPGTSFNPFEEVKPHIKEYTAREIATLSSRLEKQLGPEYISSRPGAGGGKVHYLAADKCINLANDVFGFNGWSSGIQNIQVDYVDENQITGKVSLGLSVIVRVTLRDGTYHEDVGYGHIENCKGKAAAFEKAKKEGTTDGLKRALRNFGNMLGNCIYDKEYVAKVTKLKIGPTKWDPENLHRHSDYMPIKKKSSGDFQRQPGLITVKEESSAGACDQKHIDDSDLTVCGDVDEFGSDEFDEADFNVVNREHPDEVSLETIALSETNHSASAIQVTAERNAQKLRAPAPRIPPPPSGPTLRPQTPAKTRAPGGTRSNEPGGLSCVTKEGHSNLELFIHQQGRPNADAPPGPLSEGSHEVSLASTVPPGSSSGSPHVRGDQESTKSPQRKIPSFETPAAPDHGAPVGFFTARAAETVQNISGLPLKAPAFNPHLESPSIRKTAGVDHTKTKPVGRDIIAASPTAMPPRTNFINPQIDKARRVGMPMGPASPLQNRSSYKPPMQVKRAAESPSIPSFRPALGEASVNVPFDAGGDLKRQKVAGGDGPVGVVNQSMKA